MHIDYSTTIQRQQQFTEIPCQTFNGTISRPKKPWYNSLSICCEVIKDESNFATAWDHVRMLDNAGDSITYPKEASLPL